MDKSDVITLIKRTFESNEYGVRIPSETSREVFCHVDSVTSNEFFNGGEYGLKPVYRFTMFQYDFENEEICEFNGERYTIYRTYIGTNDEIELYVEKKKGNE